jgi:hypothetical protein
VSAAKFIAEALHRLEASRADVLYLHVDDEAAAACALVTIGWLDRHAKAEAALYNALDRFPDTAIHEHLTGEE